jgi:hypothetical protein
MADKIEADPSLLEIPLANIARWLSQGHSAVKRLEGWRSMIQDAQTSREGMEKLLFILRDEEWESMMWKGFSPFPGILSKEELKRACHGPQVTETHCSKKSRGRSTGRRILLFGSSSLLASYPDDKHQPELASKLQLTRTFFSTQTIRGLSYRFAG